MPPPQQYTFLPNTPNAVPGRTLCFVHTWGTGGEDFSSLFLWLPHQTLSCHLVAVDLPGHGREPITDDSPSVRKFAPAVLSTLSNAEVAQEVILVGHGESCRIVVEVLQLTLYSRTTWNVDIKGICFLDGFSRFQRGQYHSDSVPRPVSTLGISEEELE